MNLIIVHGGQTGVDRGAHVGATDNGWAIDGYMPHNGRDELGAIPPAVARHLHYCSLPGLATRTLVNIDRAHAILVVVADKQHPYATPGTRLTLQEARLREIPRKVVDPNDGAKEVKDWLEVLTTYKTATRWKGGPLRLMIAGPRASKWPQGETETAGLLRRLKIELEGR